MGIKNIIKGFKTLREIESKLNSDGKKVIRNSFNKKSILGQCLDLNTLSKLFVAEPRDFPKLFHYTTVFGFKGICKSKEIRAGSQIFMNDPWERSFVYDYAFQYLKNFHITKSERDKFIFQVNEEPYDIYIWSFSDNYYSQALELYGDIALGFNSQDLFESINKQLYPQNTAKYGEKLIGDPKDMSFALKVVYDPNIQQQFINTVSFAWVTALRNYSNSSDIKDQTMLEIMKNCLRALFIFSLCFKNYMYRQEEEIRYVILKDDPKRTFSYAKRNSNGRPYLPLNFNTNMLKNVIISTPLFNKMGGTRYFDKILNKDGFKNLAAEKKILDY